MTPPDDAVLDALTSEGVKRAVRTIRTRSAFFRDQAKAWNSISAWHNRDLDNQTADALDAAATILELQISAPRERKETSL